MSVLKYKVEKTYTELQYVETWHHIQYFWARKTYPIKTSIECLTIIRIQNMKEKGRFFISNIEV